MLDREQVWNILCEFTKSEGLRKHALAVETCVAAYAHKFGADEQRWALTALLHDFDWEIHPTLEGHPQKGEPILAERGVDEEMRRAIRTPTTPVCRASRLWKKLCSLATNWRASSPRFPM
jgi:putative nucleotidyltransferase with HDIG domain